MTVYSQTFNKLTICALDREQHEKTCGYWYVVQNMHGPHTAFKTKAQALRWLDRLGLTIERELPEAGAHDFQWVKGSYRRDSHVDVAVFDALVGETVPCLDNAQYTKGVVTTDADGIRTLHHLNCNLPREVYDYRLTREQDECAA